MNVVDKASRCAMEATNGTKEEGTEVMPSTIPETGVEATRTDKGNPPRNAGTVARKATRRVSAGRSALIWRELDPDPDPDIPTKEIGSVRTTPKDPEKPEKGQPS